MKKTVILILLVALAVGGAVYYFSPSEEEEKVGSLVYKDLLQIDSPLANQEVTSPVRVSGQARGMWYFEASFPAEVLDEDGTSLGITPIQAEGEWMTEEYVPFSAEISFDKPKGETGIIIFHKDNPSGLPENEDSVRVPVRFK
ncbi:MAG TPA: Gmad2 immunoglobulin-like domain-containing protein [Candidatus Paceibacterota bacterium]